VNDGNIYGFFQGKNEVRQGDPLSSYLFISCMEYLSRMLKMASMNSYFNFILSVVLWVLVILLLQMTPSYFLGEISNILLVCISSSYHLGISLAWQLTEKSLLFILAELESR